MTPIRDTRISCIIAAYNEEKSIRKVIDIVATYPRFDEIIISNDGSSDRTESEIKIACKKYRHLRLLTKKVNQGKTKAIIDGVKKSKYPLLVFIDADLLSLTHQHIDSLIEPILNGEYDMTILEKGSDVYSPLGPAAYLLTKPLGGERALWKRDFEKIKFKGDERYGLEVMLNTAFIKMDKRILTVNAPDLTALWQSQKNTPVEALKRWKGMTQDIVKVTGIRGYVQQAAEIEDSRLKILNDIKHKSKRKQPILTTILLAGIGVSLASFVGLNIKRGIEKVTK